MRITNSEEIKIENLYKNSGLAVEENTRSWGKFVWINLFVLIFIFGATVGYFVNDRNISIPSFPGSKPSAELDSFTPEDREKLIDRDAIDFDLYEKLILNVKSKYVDSDKINDRKLFEGSLKGMVAAIGDKATVYFDREELTEFNNSFSGKFEGIGVRLDYGFEGLVEVVEVLKDSPAMKAGVLEGYVFSEVDGVSVTSETIEGIVTRVRGESGSKVKILFYDPVKDETVTLEIVRAKVEVESMNLVEIDKDTVVLSLSRFTEETLDSWKALWDKTVNEIVAKGYDNVILDMRGNGGGYLEAAKISASDFLDPGTLVLTEVTKSDGKKKSLAASGYQRLKGVKLVILVNGGTASAAEILAGAIRQNNDEVKIIGTKTFGKGTVQNTFDIPETGGALKITTEYWLLPNGKRLDKENPIVPDIEIERDREARIGLKEDKLVIRALEIFSDKE